MNQELKNLQLNINRLNKDGNIIDIKIYDDFKENVKNILEQK